MSSDLLPQRSELERGEQENGSYPGETLTVHGIDTDECVSLSTGREGKRSELSGTFLDVQQVAALLCITARAVRKNADSGKYPHAEKRPVNGGEGWFIPLSDLPAAAQAAYWKRRAAAVAAPSGLDDEDREFLHRRLESATEKCRARAAAAYAALVFFMGLLRQGVKKMQAYALLKAEFGVIRTTLNHWQEAVKGLPQEDWMAALTPEYSGRTNAPRADWPPAAQDFFYHEMSTPGRSIAAAYRATLCQAAIEGWGKLPSLRTAGRAWESVPDTVKAELRGDKTALKRLAPTGRRVYDMPLHDSWTMDGRLLDLMCCDVEGRFGPPGKKGRLYLYVVEEMRSRYVVGYAFEFGLAADLVRKALLTAFDHTGLVIPRQIQADNGAEFAAKEITGGAPFRRRFKVKEDEIIGMLTMLGIEPQFATVAHGQAKPVERLFGTLARDIETRPEFRRAYMGSNPVCRPEEYDTDHAIPVGTVIAAYEEGIQRYNNQKHRGAGMQGKTPQQVYTELMTAPGFIPRRITQAQRRMVALAALPVTLRANGTFCIYGAGYWSQKTAELPKGRGYTVRFNPNDLAEPVYLYRGTKLVAENVRQQTRIHGNNDKAAAKQLGKAKGEFNKATKARAEALARVLDPEVIKLRTAQKHPDLVDKKTGEILPVADVVQLAPTVVQLPTKEPQMSERVKSLIARFEEERDREFSERKR